VCVPTRKCQSYFRNEDDGVGVSGDASRRGKAPFFQRNTKSKFVLKKIREFFLQTTNTLNHNFAGSGIFENKKNFKLITIKVTRRTSMNQSRRGAATNRATHVRHLSNNKTKNTFFA
jgi:hypothetical protein